MTKGTTADICLILEGTYPYIAGGVSSWVHDLIRSQSDLTFYLVTLLAERGPRTPRYEVPPNVIGLDHIYLQDIPAGASPKRSDAELLRRLEAPLTALQSAGGLSDLAQVIDLLAPHRKRLGADTLLNSKAAWESLSRMYEQKMAGNSFLDYFWTWRAQLGGLFAVLLPDLPQARVYHTVSTGYAGVMAARAGLETGRPVILSEHGIYTNERRVEISMADWLSGGPASGFGVDKPKRDLKDLWVDTFVSYSRACYEACDRIFALFTGNQELQRRDGAPPDRLKVIPNGVDYDGYSKVVRDTTPRPPTIAFIGRVVPIKDFKTFIRAVAQVRNEVPDVQALILGPTDEDPQYFKECEEMVAYAGLGETMRFLGRVKLTDYLGKVDVIALTSISEGQPLVILEAGAAGVPTVTTDVGSCREMIEGRPDESPKLGLAGAVTPLSNPAATARALIDLLLKRELRERCGETVQKRVERYYNKREIDRIYRDIYDELRARPDRVLQAKAS